MSITIRKYSKNQFENIGISDDNIESRNGEYFICINATGNIHSVPHFKKSHTRVLNVAFDDTDVDRIKSCPSENGDVIYQAKACTEDLALVLKKFIDSIPDNSTVHIYCTKGKSRSSAVANFISEYRNQHIRLFNDFNNHVYTLLMKVKDV